MGTILSAWCDIAAHLQGAGIVAAMFGAVGCGLRLHWLTRGGSR